MASGRRVRGVIGGRRSDSNEGDATGSTTRHGGVPPVSAGGTACSLRFGERGARRVALSAAMPPRIPDCVSGRRFPWPCSREAYAR
jgi:hypothetical protein